MKRKHTTIQCWPQGRTVKRATSVFLHSCFLAGGPNKNTTFWVEHTTAAFFFFYFTAFAKVVKNGQILHQLDKNKVLWTPKLPVQTLPLSSIMLLHFFDILYVISHICGKATSVAEPATFLATPAPSLPIRLLLFSYKKITNDLLI